jgi:signal transduction histidine kinase/CheY-like chemotaxis protein
VTPFHKSSIKRKLTSVIMVTSCVALLLACSAFLVYEWSAFRSDMVSQMSTLADITGKNCVFYFDFDRPDEAQKLLSNLSSDGHVLAACIYKGGKLWAKFPPSISDASFPKLVEPPGYKFRRDSLLLFRTIVDPDNGKQVGTMFLQCDLKRIYSRIHRSVAIVSMVVVLAMIVALVLSARLQRVISEPVLNLSDTARVVSERKDYGLRAQKGSEDEVGVLIDSFNEMLAQIQKRDLELQEARLNSERANQAKSSFLSFMSHELRTPLTSIIGFSEMLITDVRAEGRDEWADDLRRVYDSGKYLLELINDILDISKIEAGKMEVHVESFDVRALIKDLADVMKPLVDQKQNRLVLDRVENLGVMQADRVKVRQCLLNLLSNASKFTENGVISLSVQRTKKNGSEWLLFEVKDTGIGMSREQMDKLFRPFTQAEDSTSRRYGGTGLGLALTRNFCQIMGGDILVASEPAKGSTFTIELPAVTSGHSQSPPVVSAIPVQGNSEGCVLVIDDDPAVHRLISEALVPEGYTLKFASNGKEGLRLAKELHPAVITLDVLMPELDGWVVLALIKADPELAGIPVIMLTVRADKDFGFAMGVADYLQKPISRERLLTALNKYHHKSPSNHVLVVEDDPGMREMLCRMLNNGSWTVLEAENGLSALESITHCRPALIILDLRMPVMDGFQMIAELRKHEDWRKIPVVVVSARELTSEDRERLQGHVLKILQKGEFSRDRLMLEVQQTVRSFLSDENETRAS